MEANRTIERLKQIFGLISVICPVAIFALNIAEGRAADSATWEPIVKLLPATSPQQRPAPPAPVAVQASIPPEPKPDAGTALPSPRVLPPAALSSDTEPSPQKQTETNVPVDTTSPRVAPAPIGRASQSSGSVALLTQKMPPVQETAPAMQRYRSKNGAVFWTISDAGLSNPQKLPKHFNLQIVQDWPSDHNYVEVWTLDGHGNRAQRGAMLKSQIKVLSVPAAAQQLE